MLAAIAACAVLTATVAIAAGALTAGTSKHKHSGTCVVKSKQKPKRRGKRNRSANAKATASRKVRQCQPPGGSGGGTTTQPPTSTQPPTTTPPTTTTPPPTTTTSPPPPASTDLALNKTATAQSIEATGLEANKGNDGNSGTRWSSAFADNQWWQVDLGSAQQVDTVKLTWEDAFATHYQIQTSTDGTNFTQAADVTMSAPGLKTTTFTARSARYVRVLGITRATQWGFSFWAAGVYGPGSTPPPPPPTTTTPPPTTTTPPPTTTTPPPTTTTPPPTTYQLSATVSGSGTITGTGISCPGDCSESYTSGTQVTLTAAPNSGNSFSGWGGACSGTGGCTVAMSAAKSVSATFAAIPPPPSGSCRTSNPGDFLTPQAGSQVIWRDDCSKADPLPLYGAFVGARVDGQQNKFTNSLSQIAPGRLSLQPSGGPSDLPHRRITVMPGDQNWGIRDALGYNWGEASDAGWGIAGPGPTVLWHEGEYHMLTTWVQLGSINTTGYFRQLLEIKQSEPYTENPARGAMFELQQREGKWMAICQWSDTWTIPVTQSAGTWVPISVEGLFSADPNKGWIKFKIGNQTSPTFHRQTLLRDTANGASVPSFMELGPYQDPSLPQFTLGFADVNVYG
jgi:F5/8 type C domain-containing protein/List-Bact-rpt repeat protein